MATVVSTLYPPLIDTFMPAFPYEGPAPVSFSFSTYNSINDIKKIHVSLVNQKTNQSAFENTSSAIENSENFILLNNIWIIPFNINGTDYMKVNTFNNTCTISIPKEILKGDKQGFVIDNYYKVQIRFDSSTVTPESTSYLQNNRQYFSEWSSVCLIKAIPNIDLGMVGFDDQYNDIEQINVVSKIRTVQAGIVPIVGNVIFNYNEHIKCTKCSQIKTLDMEETITMWKCSNCNTWNVKDIISTNNTETLQKYQISIFSDSSNEIIDKTKGWIYTNDNANPNKIYWLADVTNAQPDSVYNVYIECITKNQYYFTKTYQIKIANFDATSFTPVWSFQTIQLNEYNNSIDKIITEEDGMVTFTITSLEEMPQGFLYVKRASSLDNFKKWELISCTENFGRVNVTITDPTIGSMVKYRYACQYRLKKNNNFTETKYSEMTITEEGITKIKPIYVYPNFYDVLIYRDNKQIALRYNTQITSYSSVVNRQVINTLGSKYPKFAENAQMNYKKFTITGLITTESDFNRKFINDRDLASEMEDYDQYMDGKYEIRNDTISDYTFTYAYNISEREYPHTKGATQHLVPNTLHDLYPKDNWWLERRFRDEALSWLNDGEPKLFKSMTEGNMVVMLTDISLTPNTQIGRRTYNISMTAYEVEDGYSLDTLSTLGIIQVPNEYNDYIGSIASGQEEESEEDEESIQEEYVISQLYSKKGHSSNLIYDQSLLIEKPSVDSYTIDNFYNGLYYQGINNSFKVVDGSYRLKDLKIQFETPPQWYEVSIVDNAANYKIADIDNISNINNLVYGYKLELEIWLESQQVTKRVQIFVGEKGYYQVPSNLIVSDVILDNNVIATLDFKLSYKREYDESSVPSSAEIAQKIIGQVSGKWSCKDSIAERIKNKYEYYSRANDNKEGYNGLLEIQYLDKIAAFGFDGTTYTTLQIIFEGEELGNEYVVGRTGVYNLMTEFPIEDVIFLGRRMFRKDNPQYTHEIEPIFRFDPSTAGYQAVPINSLGWYGLDDEQFLDVIVVLDDQASTPEKNQIVRNWIDVETEFPYSSINDITPTKNTIYGVFNENDDVILMLYTQEGNWVKVELEYDGSHTILGIDAKTEEIRTKKEKFFLEEWEFSLDESAADYVDEDLYWYKVYLGNTQVPVQINNTSNIRHYITDINGKIIIPAIDGYLLEEDITNPEYNVVYGFYDGVDENGNVKPKKYKIYYIDQQWYDIDFILDSNNSLILAHVPVYGMVNYRGNLVKIRYV